MVHIRKRRWNDDRRKEIDEGRTSGNTFYKKGNHDLRQIPAQDERTGWNAGGTAAVPGYAQDCLCGYEKPAGAVSSEDGGDVLRNGTTGTGLCGRRDPCQVVQRELYRFFDR